MIERYAGLLFEGFHDQMAARAHAPRSVIETTALRFGIGDEIFDIFNRRCRIHN